MSEFTEITPSGPRAATEGPVKRVLQKYRVEGIPYTLNVVVIGDQIYPDPRPDLDKQGLLLKADSPVATAVSHLLMGGELPTAVAYKRLPEPQREEFLFWAKNVIALQFGSMDEGAGNVQESYNAVSEKDQDKRLTSQAAFEYLRETLGEGGANIMDGGCGTAYYLKRMKDMLNISSYVGFDPVESFVDEAQNTADNLGIPAYVYQGDFGTEMPEEVRRQIIEAGGVHAWMGLFVAHFIEEDDLVNALANTRDLLVDGGKVVFTVVGSKANDMMLGFPPEVKIEFTNPPYGNRIKGVVEHHQTAFFSGGADYYEKIAERAGYKLVLEEPIRVDSEYRQSLTDHLQNHLPDLLNGKGPRDLYTYSIFQLLAYLKQSPFNLVVLERDNRN